MLRGENCDCNFNNVEKALEKIVAQIKKNIIILSACDPDEKMLNTAIGQCDNIKLNQ